MTLLGQEGRFWTRWRLGGLAATMLACAGIVAADAPAAARHLTLRAEHVSALNATVLAAPNGHTLYRLKPETPRHLLCKSSACLGLWHPLTVKSRSTRVRLPRGLRGHTRFLRRGPAFQVVLGRALLYTYAGDSRPHQANGRGIKSFGGTWLTITVKKDAAPSPAPAPTMPGPYPY